MIYKAIILAAGMGMRLKPLTDTQPKCLTEVNGRQIIQNAIEILAHYEVKETIIVVGYLSDKIKQAVGYKYGNMEINYITNDIYDKTNTSYSLKLALDEVDSYDRLLILEGDVFFDAEIINNIMKQELPNITMVQKYNPTLDGSFVELNEGNNVIDWVHKKNRLKDYVIETKYKTVNIHQFDRAFINNYLLPSILQSITEQNGKSPMEDIMRTIVTQKNDLVKGIETGSIKWFEIDDENDLKIAEQIFR